MSLDFSVDLHASLDKLSGELSGVRGELRAQREIAKSLQPIHVSLFNSASSTGTADFGISLDGPDPGFYWVVRSIVLGGQTPSTTVSGTGEVYVTGLTPGRGLAVSGNNTITGIRNLNELADTYASLPKVAFYSTDQIIVQENQSLVGVVHGPSSSTLYVMRAQVEVIRTAALPVVNVT